MTLGHNSLFVSSSSSSSSLLPLPEESRSLSRRIHSERVGVFVTFESGFPRARPRRHSSTSAKWNIDRVCQGFTAQLELLAGTRRSLHRIQVTTGKSSDLT
ncbi:unnamed protein product [Pleuronectes platessa]|uniref:Uncharacterized protein n=1 Tax=Pleuronectes platessa TaxID=8262 RepID=A0A9N7UHG1_PLEPL|nr:unnamed protein product [Pleuronectes platessa]